MKKLLLAAALISSAMFIGCKSSGGGDPKQVLSDFFDALSKKDMAAAKELATPESKDMLDMMSMAMKSDKSSEELSKYDKTKMEFGEPVISGDNAKVPVKEKSTGETTNFPLKKVGGKWKVAFDKSSMMQMGMEKMNEKGVNIGDSINKGMDEIKNMNMDSMSKEINKAMDSATKSANP